MAKTPEAKNSFHFMDSQNSTLISGQIRSNENNDFKHAKNDMKCESCENSVKMYGSVVVGTKGQIVIPSEVRKSLNINPGDSMCVVTKHGKAVGLVKMDDLQEFMDYMQAEMDAYKQMAK